MSAQLLETWRREIAAVLQRHQPQLPSNLDDLCNALRAVTDATDSRRALASRAEEARTAYRRWLVAEGDGYSAILIGWPPSYHTPVHDHDGLWGIELVLCGALHVDEFRLVTGKPEEVRALDLKSDGAAIFDDAAYAHACSNPSADAPALSLHVYGGPLLSYAVYPQTDGLAAQRKSTATSRSESSRVRIRGTVVSGMWL
jgi:predicted metal-dependent enzyme (double-stranded beta helix superfamily)